MRIFYNNIIVDIQGQTGAYYARSGENNMEYYNNNASRCGRVQY